LIRISVFYKKNAGLFVMALLFRYDHVWFIAEAAKSGENAFGDFSGRASPSSIFCWVSRDASIFSFKEKAVQI